MGKLFNMKPGPTHPGGREASLMGKSETGSWKMSATHLTHQQIMAAADTSAQSWEERAGTICLYPLDSFQWLLYWGESCNADSLNLGLRVICYFRAVYFSHLHTPWGKNAHSANSSIWVEPIHETFWLCDSNRELLFPLFVLTRKINSLREPLNPIFAINNCHLYCRSNRLRSGMMRLSGLIQPYSGSCSEALCSAKCRARQEDFCYHNFLWSYALPPLRAWITLN